MTRWNRTAPVLALVLVAGAALVGSAGTATAAEDASASVSEVTCTETDGDVTVTVTAGDGAPAVFFVLVDGEGGESTEVPAGESRDVTSTGLEDGDHTFEVLLEPAEEEGETLTLASETRAVACDVAPVGPYSNPKGEVSDFCEGTAHVTASNKPIAGNVADLQAVEFLLTFTPTDDPPIDGGEDPVDGGDGSDGGDGGGEDPVEGGRSAADPPRDLETFVLDATTPTYDRLFSAAELESTGDLALYADGVLVASGHIGGCYVVSIQNTEGGGGPVVAGVGY